MAHTFGTASVMERGASTTITSPPFTPAAGSTCLVLVLVVITAQTRTGGAPTYAGVVLTQADTAQKAATGAEASIEVWYLTGAAAGVVGTAVIPNSGQRTIHYLLATGCAAPGSQSVFDGAVGSNGSSLTPSPGSLSPTLGGAIVFVAHAGGHQDGPLSRTHTVIAETDHGTTVSGIQYTVPATVTPVAASWTYDTAEDWGAVAVAFRELLPVRSLNAAPGDVGLTGAAVALTRGRSVLTTAGVVALTGSPATFQIGRALVTDAGGLEVMGAPAAGFIGTGLATVPGAIDVTGASATCLVTRALTMAPGFIAITGASASLAFGGAPPTTAIHLAAARAGVATLAARAGRLARTSRAGIRARTSQLVGR